jgi:hypothetical protein
MLSRARASAGGAVMETTKHKFQASEATRESILLRAAFCGPTGSGKTKTGLILGTRMVERLGCGPLFVIDSESRSALRYAPSRNGGGYRFKHVPMPEDDCSPASYMAALDYCEAQGAGVVLIDSLSHAWNGINGVLELVDKLTSKSRSGNAFSEGWKTMTPAQNRLIQRILGSSAHVLFTLRAKVEWVMQENDRGKKEPIKVGLGPVQREGVDYEPDLFFDMTVPKNDLIVSKSRCDRLAPGETFKKPGNDLADVIIEWIQDAEPATGARSLGEALFIAVMAGIAAAEAGDAEGKKAAVAGLMTWCKAHGISEERYEATRAQMIERVKVATAKSAKEVVNG